MTANRAVIKPRPTSKVTEIEPGPMSEGGDPKTSGALLSKMKPLVNQVH